MKKTLYSFPRESRLLTPSAFSNVFDKAIPAVSPQITLLARPNKLEIPRLGITVPKKKVKLASNRNRIKRCVRESFRLIAHDFPNVDIIVIAKQGVGDMDNKAIFEQLEKQWRKLKKRCQ
ncbi:ribonuclease P protein component [Agaribacter marinus]|uniref:Ribonuclease P protein component n=1 Tax=Agaribacter marinus TaxID=1431249 RepID=A0AA37WIM0_9ALTE|nr:ribonuclease P protein component [Agaribacter marinus]GLR71268.1 ribonuclease P protein component [Agaribacter marinus]